MTPIPAKDATSASRESALAAFHEIRSCLEATRDRLCSDISRYPTPIPGCDVDFNCLLAERARVFRELARLERLRDELSVAAMEDFITRSEAIPSADRCKLATAVSVALARGEA